VVSFGDAGTFLSMSDPTTDGLEPTPAEIDGMVRNLCAYALGEPDPIQRYEGLTHQQVLFEGMVEALRRERGRLVADLVVAGASVTEVAQQTSLGTVVKVRKLISLADQTQRVNEATAARKEATRKGKPGREEEADACQEKAGHRADAGAGREPLPQHLAVPNGKRLLTPDDRAALGLPV